MDLTRRTFLSAALAGALGGIPSRIRAESTAPNILFIYADDLGYGDLGCYGSKIPTPNLDRMAAEGVRFTQFYSASNICSPSRAALMTGRYPTRAAVPYVLSTTTAATGLGLAETTVAQVLKAAGYATSIVGKWHLGVQPQYLPCQRGFDQYFGIPYSNDMWPLPMMQNNKVVQDEVVQNTLTAQFTARAVSTIQNAGDAPFFLYLAYSAPHIPLAPSPAFRGSTKQGAYADVVAEMDSGIGQVMQALKDNGLDQNTLVMFASDNGPWYQGSPGDLRGRKAECWEGGMREPFIARFPGQIPAGTVCNTMASTMDILPTLARLAAAPLPAQPLDGLDIWPLLTGAQDLVDRDLFLYFDGWNLQAARWGRWKLHVARNNTPAWSPAPAVGGMNLPLPAPELYDLETDPGEDSECSADNPDVVAQMQSRINEMLPTFPQEVQNAWRDTLNRHVQYSPPGALPVLQTP